MNLFNYLQYLSEQQLGLPPQRPVQKPRGPNRPRFPKQKIPKVPGAPINPQLKQMQNRPKRTMDQIKNDAFQAKKAPTPAVVKPVGQTPIAPKSTPVPNPKSYFDYMLWTSNVLKQGEIFRKNCYGSNCQEFAAGSGDRRICKDRCDIETCKKVIQMLQVSQTKCAQSNNPDKCKVRYMQLIPLYQEKLNKISKKFIEADKRKKKSEIKVG